jgi:hypothetical protein
MKIINTRITIFFLLNSLGFIFGYMHNTPAIYQTKIEKIQNKKNKPPYSIRKSPLLLISMGAIMGRHLFPL